MDHDSLRRFRQYLVDHGVATDEQFDKWEVEDKQTVEQARKNAWDAFQNPIKEARSKASELIKSLAQSETNKQKELGEIESKLVSIPDPLFRDVAEGLHKALVLTADSKSDERKQTFEFNRQIKDEKTAYYDKFFLSDSSIHLCSK